MQDSAHALDGEPEAEGTLGPHLSVVIPLYNEQEVLPALFERTLRTLEGELFSFEIVCVDDGSTDATAALLDALAESEPRLTVVHLSRNFGHQAAVSAGLDHARGNAVVVMDGDLQDPPELIPRMLEMWQDGNDVVYAVRRGRKEGLIRRAGYFLFYRALRAVSDLEIPLDSGDFCLMDRRVVDVLCHLPERLRFIRGLRTFAGFRQAGLPYDRPARGAGQAKYSFLDLIRLAVDGLVSFSSYPLHVVTHLGVASLAVAFLLTVWVVVDAILGGTSPRGWASLVIVVLFMSSIQLISLGIIGEYVRRIFLETKGRPTYIVREIQTHGRSESRREPHRSTPAGMPNGSRAAGKTRAHAPHFELGS